MTDNIKLLKEVVIGIQDIGPDQVKPYAELIRESGITPSVHVGDDPASFDNEKTAEWILGQFLSIIDQEGWFAMNSMLNYAIGFLEKNAV